MSVLISVAVGLIGLGVIIGMTRMWISARAKSAAVSPLGKPLRADPDALGARIERLAKDLTAAAAESEDIARQARQTPSK